MVAVRMLIPPKFVLTGHIPIKLGKLNFKYVSFHCHTIGFGGFSLLLFQVQIRHTNDDINIDVGIDIDVAIAMNRTGPSPNSYVEVLTS